MVFVCVACDSGGMVGFCARRAQRALFQTHSALTDAVSTLKFQGSNMHDIAAIYTMQPKNNSSLRTRTAR